VVRGGNSPALTPTGVQIAAGDTAVPPALFSYDQARAQLRGTVRMETPVIYFYSPEEATVHVRVDFPKGFMSEWYPSAAVVQPVPQQIPLDSTLTSSILWNYVTIMPGTSPTLKQEKAPSHYYAARETDAHPLRVNGQFEKFLFYRGVGGFQVPILATETSDGNIAVTNTGNAALPFVVLFENRDGKVGYRIHGELANKVELKPAEPGGDIHRLYRELESALVKAGMFQREAQAMVNTWRDSWFEEGERLFYILPASTVDAILPLSISPAPEKIARAFVGRVELITSETLKRVSRAIEMEDEQMLLRYGRFLGPITDRLLEGASPAASETIKRYVDGLFSAFVERSTAVCGNSP
jgi:hypothetical protein